MMMKYIEKDIKFGKNVEGFSPILAKKGFIEAGALSI
jgi:hypothetical protein